MNPRPVNILLVEDDEIDVMNVRRAFERAGIAAGLWTAADGVEAMAALRGEDFPRARRLVLLDLNLPRMSGGEFLRALRADAALAPTPVVVLTTSDAQRDREHAFRHNVAGYLVKPTRFADFMELMTALDRFWSLSELA